MTRFHHPWNGITWPRGRKCVRLAAMYSNTVWVQETPILLCLRGGHWCIHVFGELMHPISWLICIICVIGRFSRSELWGRCTPLMWLNFYGKGVRHMLITQPWNGRNKWAVISWKDCCIGRTKNGGVNLDISMNNTCPYCIN